MLQLQVCNLCEKLNSEQVGKKLGVETSGSARLAVAHKKLGLTWLGSAWLGKQAKT
jgi:hypothetical protein